MNLYVIHILVLIAPTWALLASTSGTLLQKGTQGRSLNGYTLESVTVDSLAKCSLLCEANTDCYSINFEFGVSEVARCDLVYCNALENNSALISNTAMTYYGQVIDGHSPICDACIHKPCQNGGTCMVTGTFPSNFTCQCSEFFTGELCEQPVLDEDCGIDPTFTGDKHLMTSGGRIFKAYCDLGWTYVFKRFDGSVDFYRNWTEYQQGFGDPVGEHFIGLDNLASLLKQSIYKVRFDLTPWPSNISTLLTGFAEYSTFDMADESDKYRLTIGGYSGTAGDAMNLHNGQQFTTYDQDNDAYGTNCAQLYKGAWWYNKCHHSNLFGMYINGTICPEFAVCVNWRLWPENLAYPQENFYISFKEAYMKIQRL